MFIARGRASALSSSVMFSEVEHAQYTDLFSPSFSNHWQVSSKQDVKNTRTAFNEMDRTMFFLTSRM
jgi:hypothetical protein